MDFVISFSTIYHRESALSPHILPPISAFVLATGDVCVASVFYILLREPEKKIDQQPEDDAAESVAYSRHYQ